MFNDMDFGSEFGWDDQEQLAVEAYELYEQGQMYLALEQIDQALELNPSNTALNFNKALILDALGKYEAAIDFYNSALENKPNDPEIYNSLAVDYTRTGLYDLAIETFNEALSVDPEFEPAYCNSIITYTEMAKYEKAEESFYMAQQLNEECPLCFYNIGNSLFCRGDMERALWCWEKTRYLDCEHPQINYRIAQAHWAMGNTALADEYFLAELRINPGNVEVLLDYALFLIQSKNYPSAREKLNRIIELKPDFSQAYQYLGEIDFNNGDVESAEKHFRKALTLEDIPGPHYRLGQIEFQRGRRDNSIMHFKHELSLEVEDFDVLISIGTMLLKMDEYDFSTQCFLRATDEEPKNSLPFYYMGMCMYKAGEAEDAKHFFSYAKDLDDGDVKHYVMLAKCHLKCSRYHQAGEVLYEALEKFPCEKTVLHLLRVVKLSKLKKRITDFWQKRLK